MAQNSIARGVYYIIANDFFGKESNSEILHNYIKLGQPSCYFEYCMRGEVCHH